MFCYYSEDSFFSANWFSPSTWRVLDEAGKWLQRGIGTTTEQHRGGCTQLVEISKENVVDEAKQKIEHLEQSLKAAIEIHKLELEVLRVESLAEAAEKETHQWVRTVVTRGWSSIIFILLGVKKDVLSEEI